MPDKPQPEERRTSRRDFLAGALGAAIGLAAGYGIAAYNRKLDNELRMGLPLYEMPVKLEHVSRTNAARLDIKFEHNYLKAMREKFETAEIEAYVHSERVSRVFDLKSTEPGVVYSCNVRPSPGPNFIPFEMWGVTKNGRKVLVHSNKRPPGDHANGF